MGIIDTMAVKITEETYPIAVACLAGGFAKFAFSKVEGRYLVINELQIKIPKKDDRPILIVGNGWMEEDYFKKNYTFVEKETPNKFASVRKI